MWGSNLRAGKIHVLGLFQEGNRRAAGSRHEATEKRTSPSNKSDKAFNVADRHYSKIVKKGAENTKTSAKPRSKPQS
ncbi:hypothetical protein B6A27_17460 [Anoxybacillus sp. UARK-01]|nr:hypothetical protein B6A27_17460 [Anoxybacillus sp. UARK-01]